MQGEKKGSAKFTHLGGEEKKLGIHKRGVGSSEQKKISGSVIYSRGSRGGGKKKGKGELGGAVEGKTDMLCRKGGRGGDGSRLTHEIRKDQRCRGMTLLGS